MKFTKVIEVIVNGKSFQAKVSLEAPGLSEESFVDPKQILLCAASGQNMSVHSRHHKDRTVRFRATPEVVCAAPAQPKLKLVAAS